MAMTGKKLFINFLLVALSFQCAPKKPPILECSDVCGKSLAKHLQTRIVDGSDIGYYKYPWYGILKHKTDLQCGVTMISDIFAITTASCFRDFLPVQPGHNITGVYTVTLGVYNRCDSNETTQKVFEVNTVYLHAGFELGKRGNNIALIKLSGSTGFEPICLPSKAIPVDQRPSEGIIVGAGLVTYEPLERTCYVNEARVLIYDNESCNKSLTSIGEDPSLLSTTFCAGGAKVTKPYGCGADLGGPLMATNDNGTLYIFGIISFKKCPENDNLTLYQDVSEYLDWIHQNIDEATPATTAPTTIAPAHHGYPDYDYSEHETSSSTTETTTTSTTTTTKSSVVLGGGSKRHHNGHHHHENKKHGKHSKREIKDEHLDEHTNTGHFKGKHFKHGLKKHHHHHDEDKKKH